ncbi:chemotaxis protein CheA [Flocculibacter collagenilyticus]|uniref:chemotaxis protein CheA n=1 Tax=Flocculibacter collagenilyticus TaxID=2744479 RepID=UPI0018F5AD36|nr:chemotaxis protein CheA [Flocculibacter collagenilyticus]
MSIDLSQFYQVFFEESFEGLDIMESELLSLSPGEVDSETINTIFRAAHSIKGGGGTFGFNVVTEFTHGVETLLDQIRDGQRELTQYHIDLLLQSVDCLRDLLTALQDEQEVDEANTQDVQQKIEAVLNDEEPGTATAPANEAAPSAPPEIEPDKKETNEEELGYGFFDESYEQDEDAPQGEVRTTKFWEISFIPEPHLFKTGNEPLFIFRELADLAELSVTADTSKLLPLKEHVIDDCMLSWKLTLTGDVTEEQINEVFEWVEDDAEIKLELIAEFEDEDTEVNEEDKPVEAAAAQKSESTLTPSPTTEADAPKTVQTAQAKTSDVPSSPPAKATPAKASSGGKAKKPKESKSSESTSIRVGIDKVDSLINIVGELVITQAMLSQVGEGEFDEHKQLTLQEGLAQLAHNTRDLQESVMRIRMLPISFVFSRFPRVVRDTANKLGKKVELKLIGEQTELDKTVMEKISDPMVHLVRNSLDHGLETPEERAAVGKGETGTVILNAFHQGGNIVIEIKDDGKGLNTEKIKSKAIENGLISQSDDLTDDEIHLLIFQPGFSTADQVSDISGRGVGMDVVRRNIESLNGSIEVMSEANKGSTFTIRLPLTLAILDGQLVKVSTNTYIIPLISIIESLQVDLSQVNKVGGGLEVLRLRDEYIPIIKLYKLFHHDGAVEKLEDGLLVIVEADNEKVGLLVDDLLGQQQVVIKSLEANYGKVPGISGATILGDGRVSLIVDIAGLIQLARLKKPGHQGLDFERPVDEAV